MRESPGSPDITQIDITLTTPLQPAREALTAAVRRAVSHTGLPGVEVQLVFEPAWTPYQMRLEPLRCCCLPTGEPQGSRASRGTYLVAQSLRRRFARL